MSNNKQKIVFVAMSGGVDSSVAAALLKERGYDVIGAHIKCFNIDDCGERDAEDARRVAEQLKIPFYVFDLEREYKEKVVRYMIDGYKQGITPNPDVMCNKEIKFGLFFQRALQLGADFIATGHYVRLRKQVPQRVVFSRTCVVPTLAVGTRLLLARKTPDGDRAFSGSESFSQTPPVVEPFLNTKNDSVEEFSQQLQHHSQTTFALFEGKDKNKDQSYFLWTLTQEQLKHCLFPIGEYTKPQVRKLAKKYSLLTAEKKDSQGICFLGQIKLDDFLADHIKSKVGQVLLTQGDGSHKIIGQHKGVYFYTIGQRSGLGIGGTKKPLYVVEKNTKQNTIIVVEGANDPALYRKEVILTNVNFIANYSNVLKNLRMSLLVRVRYRQPLVKATLTCNNLKPKTYNLIFDKPQKFVAPGQSAVFYDKSGQMLGGGVIM